VKNAGKIASTLFIFLADTLLTADWNPTYLPDIKVPETPAVPEE